MPLQYVKYNSTLRYIPVEVMDEANQHTQRRRRRQREEEARRQDVLEAADQLFSHQGFFKTSMAEIAEAAAFAIGTIYKLFPSKEAIYIALIESKMEEFDRLLHAELARRKGVVAKLEAVIRLRLAYADRNRDFFKVYVSEWSGFEWTIKSAFGERIWRRYLDQLTLVADLIRTGIRDKQLRPIEPEAAAAALHGMLNSIIYLGILQASPPGALTSQYETVRNLIFDGLVATDGRSFSEPPSSGSGRHDGGGSTRARNARNKRRGPNQP